MRVAQLLRVRPFRGTAFARRIAIWRNGLGLVLQDDDLLDLTPDLGMNLLEEFKLYDLPHRSRPGGEPVEDLEGHDRRLPIPVRRFRDGIGDPLQFAETDELIGKLVIDLEGALIGEL